MCANPILPTSDLDLRVGATFAFEVFERDATSLQPRLGEEHQYSVDSRAISGKLTSLEPCRSTHPGLSFLRDTPTLRGILDNFKSRRARLTPAPKAGVMLNAWMKKGAVCKNRLMELRSGDCISSP